MVKQDQINELVARLVKGYKPDKVILFGSYAYGNPTEDSDLDLLVIKEDPRPRNERYMEASSYLGRRLGFPVDILVMTPTEFDNGNHRLNTLVYNISQEGKVLYVKGE